MLSAIDIEYCTLYSHGSRIATNAKLIRHGNFGLEYGDDFSFIDSPDITESAEKIVELFLPDRYFVYK